MRFGTRRVVATITHADGSVEKTPDDQLPFDRLMFERRFATEWMQWDELREEYLYFVAWVQLHRAAIAAKELTFDDFDPWMLSLASCQFEVLEDELEEAEPFPTESAASTTE